MARDELPQALQLLRTASSAADVRARFVEIHAGAYLLSLSLRVSLCVCCACSLYLVWSLQPLGTSSASARGSSRTRSRPCCATPGGSLRHQRKTAAVSHLAVMMLESACLRCKRRSSVSSLPSHCCLLQRSSMRGLKTQLVMATSSPERYAAIYGLHRHMCSV